jgi:hypothetical protein
MTRPKSDSAAYQAAAIIHKSGPQTAAQLIGQIDFGSRPSNRLGKIESAAASGWLVEVRDVFSLGDAARVFFDSIKAEMPKYVGQVAAPREPLTPLHLRPALKYKTDSSGSNVRDIDARFQRAEGHHFFTVSSGVA